MKRKERVVEVEGVKELGKSALLEIEGGNNAQSENFFTQIREAVYEWFGINKED